MKTKMQLRAVSYPKKIKISLQALGKRASIV
jgi:hypothetical protein